MSLFKNKADKNVKDNQFLYNSYFPALQNLNSLFWQITFANEAMTDERLMQVYATGMFMLALLDEWNKIERIGIVAKIYNTITKKHNVFHAQHADVQRGKKKKYSKKCELFLKASAYSVITWEKVLKETKDATLISNTTIHNLYRLISEDFTRIYGLSEDDFRKIDNRRNHGFVLQSCKVARLLNEESAKLIGENAGTKDIYKLLHGEKNKCLK